MSATAAHFSGGENRKSEKCKGLQVKEMLVLMPKNQIIIVSIESVESQNKKLNIVVS